MSDVEYNRIRNIPLAELGRLGAYELRRFIDACSPVQKQFILNALSKR